MQPHSSPSSAGPDIVTSVHRSSGEPPPVLFGPGRRQGALPILVGLWGHADLIGDADLTRALETRVESIFKRLRKLYPHTPLVALTTLAEGAERLAARVALNQGARLVVLLPGPPAVVRASLAAASREEFDRLLGQAERVFIAPAESADVRRLGAAFVAHYSQVLIALLDDDAAIGQGTEGEVVHFWRAGVPEDLLRLLPVRTQRPVGSRGRPLFVIPTPHGAVRGHQLGPVNAWRRSNHRQYASVLRRIEVCNRDTVGCALVVPLRDSQEDLLPGQELPPLPPGQRDGAIALRAWYGVFDALALRFQRQNQTLLTILFLTLWLSGYFVQVAIRMPGLATSLYYTVAAVVTFLAGFSWWFAYGRRHVAYRVVAEELRVLFFGRLAGVRGTITTPNPAPPGQEQEPWIAEALANWALLSDRDYPVPTGPDAGLALVDSRWVRNQIEYFHNRGPRLEKTRQRILAWRIALFAVGGVWVTLRLLSWISPVIPTPATWLIQTFHLGFPLDAALHFLGETFAVGVFVLAGLLVNLEHQMQSRSQTVAYATTLQLFERYEGLLRHAAGNLTEQRRLVAELAQHALAEARAWGNRHGGTG